MVNGKPARLVATSFYLWLNQFKLYLEGFGFPNFMNFSENLIRLDARAHVLPLYKGAPPISDLLEPPGIELQRHVLLCAKKYCWSIPMPSAEEILCPFPRTKFYSSSSHWDLCCSKFTLPYTKLPSRLAAKPACTRTCSIISAAVSSLLTVLPLHWQHA